MAKIELNYTDEELTTLLNGLNNAYIALSEVYAAGRLGCQVPRVLEPIFETRSFDEMMEETQLRQDAVKQLYYFLLSYEQK